MHEPVIGKRFSMPLKSGIALKMVNAIKIMGICIPEKPFLPRCEKTIPRTVKTAFIKAPVVFPKTMKWTTAKNVLIDFKTRTLLRVFYVKIKNESDNGKIPIIWAITLRGVAKADENQFIINSNICQYLQNHELPLTQHLQ